MILMLSTAARGGIRAVAEGYVEDGLFDVYKGRWIFTHQEGGAFKRFSVFLKALFPYIKILASGKISLVHCHMAMRGSFWRKSFFAGWARFFSVPVVLHLHGSEMKVFYAAQPAISKQLIRQQLEKASRVVVLSDGWKDFVQAIAPSARVVVLPNYVVVPTMAHVPVSNVPHPVRFLFMGALGRRKGIYDLLDAFAKLIAVCPEARLLVGGNGDIEGVQSHVDQLRLTDQVSLLGWVSGPRKTELLSQVDVFVLPSYNEGLPMAILEAMARRLPVISTRVGAIPEVICDGIEGLLIEPGDSKALESALIAICKDKTGRLSMGAAAYARVSQCYSRDVVLPRLYKIYDELISENKV